MRVLAASTLALALRAAEKRADQIFSLSGVTFGNGTTATGTFTTNDALTTLIGYDITTVNGAITGFVYTPATANSGSTSLPTIIVLEPASLDHVIQLTFDGGLTLAGAPISNRTPPAPIDKSSQARSSPEGSSPNPPRSPWPGPPRSSGWGC